MHRLRRLSPSAWVLVGLAAGAIAVPGVALATGASLVTINGNGHNASVSGGGQIRAVEMDPANFVHGSGGSAGDCVALAVAPAGRALVIKQINIDAAVVNTGAFATIASSPTCASGGSVAVVDLPQRGVTSLPLGTGIPVRAGTGLYVQGHNATVFAEAMGYSLTSSAVPAGVAAGQHIGSADEGRVLTRAR